MFGFLAFIFVWHLTVYAPIAHIVWHPDGYFRSNEVEDFAGGIVVHMLSSITIIALHLYLNWKGVPKEEPKAPKDTSTLLVNSFVVWFLWFGLNAGKAHNAGPVAAQSIVNTIGGVGISIFFNFLIDIIFDFEFNEVEIVNAILMGLIATTPSSGYVTVGGSMIVTLFVVISTRILANWYMKEGNNAPYSIATLHGFGGTVAFLFTAMLSYKFINNEGLGGLTFGNQTAIRHHLAVILAFWPCALIAVFICIVVSDLFVSLVRDPNSTKGAYEPTPIGPLRTTVEVEEVYKPPSSDPDAAAAETA